MRRTRALFTAICIALLPAGAMAAHAHPERFYEERWCRAMGGRTEVTLADRTRVDCLTAEYAVEVDFAAKWAESIGQALYYAGRTGRRPGILIILEDPAERRFLQRLRSAIGDFGLPVRVWQTGPGAVLLHRAQWRPLAGEASTDPGPPSKPSRSPPRGPGG